MPWKPEYAAARRAKYKADPAERERRKAQGRDSADNIEYMQRYYAANKDKFAEYQRLHNDERQAARRERYASDPEYREKCKAAARGRDKDVVRNGKLFAAYGITNADYDRMLDAQQGACAICGRSSGDGTRRRLSVDHCHTKGHVRGLLCGACNMGLGQFKDDPSRLYRALQYLTGAMGPVGGAE